MTIEFNELLTDHPADRPQLWCSGGSKTEWENGDTGLTSTLAIAPTQ